MAVRSHADEPRKVNYGKTQNCDIGELLEFPDFNILCQNIEGVGTDHVDLVFVLQSKAGQTKQVMRLNSIDAPIALFKVKRHKYQFEVMSPGIKISRKDKD